MRGGMRRIGLTAVILAALAAPAWAGAQGYGDPYPPSGSGMGSGGTGSAPTAQVGANGNPFSGGLSYTPPQVTVGVGQVVQWTNTDSFVPHTVTEDHVLFDLAGDYGATPANPGGFGPGTSVQRAFSAGT